MDRIFGFAIGTLMLGFIVLVMFLVPQWNVWRSELTGRAEFKRAEQNRLIQVEEAKANLEAQKLNSQAEVERAKGMAEAIQIEDGKLTPQYIQYLWVRNLNQSHGEKIYIATEANLPILEAR